jgi:hypothetical protein
MYWMVPMIAPAVVSGVSGLGPLSVAAAVNEGGADAEPDALCIPTGFASPKSISFAPVCVSRLQIAVNNAVAMRKGQSLCNSDPDLVCLRQRERIRAQAVGHRLAFEKLHYEIISAVLRSNVIEMADVWMI